MAENTIRIEFDDKDGGRGGQQAPPPGRSDVPAARTGIEPDKSKPVSVELTKENADLIADYLRGKTTSQEVLDKLTGGPDPITTPGTIPNPGTVGAAPGGAGEFVGPTFARADFVGPQLPDADPIAKLIKSAGFATPEGGDDEIQSELFRQFKKQEDRDKTHAARLAADADKLSKREAGEADRRTDEMVDSLGRFLGLGPVSGTIRGALGGAEAAGAVGAEGIGGRVVGAVASRAAGIGITPAVGGMLLAGTVADAALDWLIAKPFGMVRPAADQATKGLQGIARNDPTPILEGAVDALADFAGNTGIAGKVFGEQLRTVAAFGRAFGDTVDAFVKRGRELRGLDQNLATAAAMQDVARLQADIREAQVTGEALGRLTQSQTEVELLGREIMLTIKTEVIGALAAIAEPIGAFAAANTRVVRILGDAHRTATGIPKQIAHELLKDSIVEGILRWVHEKFVGKVKEEERNSLLEQVFEAARNVPIGPDTARDERIKPEQVAGAPMFFGR